ncbi:unnamed protein product [Leuciscus chuanchicus]
MCSEFPALNTMTTRLLPDPHTHLPLNRCRRDSITSLGLGNNTEHNNGRYKWLSNGNSQVVPDPFVCMIEMGSAEPDKHMKGNVLRAEGWENQRIPETIQREQRRLLFACLEQQLRGERGI